MHGAAPEGLKLGRRDVAAVAAAASLLPVVACTHMHKHIHSGTRAHPALGRALVSEARNHQHAVTTVLPAQVMRPPQPLGAR